MRSNTQLDRTLTQTLITFAYCILATTLDILEMNLSM